MRKKRRVWPHTAALARSDIRAPAVRARVINLAIVPSAARSSPASPLSVAYLLGDPAARSDKGELFMDQDANRRDLLLASVVTAALPFGLSFSVSGASASPINPAETIIKLPADLAWKPNPNNPPRSSDSYALAGSPTEPGLYYTLVRWWPGYMSAPHTYTSDRFCMVMSGTWWCNSGNDFDPASCVPATAGSFVRRVAGTPHYDGVIRNRNEPAIIAICGIGPVNYKLVDPSKPGWRAV
jgi:hypothetical protein